MNISPASEPTVTFGSVRSTVAGEQIVDGSVITTEGTPGRAIINTLTEDADVQPTWFVTVKVYVPGSSPDTVLVEPEPLVFTPPGFWVSIHMPEGNPSNTTLPVGKANVGWVIVPASGCDGVTGCSLITAFDDITEVHPSEFLIAKL